MNLINDSIFCKYKEDGKCKSIEFRKDGGWEYYLIDRGWVTVEDKGGFRTYLKTYWIEVY